eukprot:scaffold125892_cov20-Tisochrysis_lutea.AAC.1
MEVTHSCITDTRESKKIHTPNLAATADGLAHQSTQSYSLNEFARLYLRSKKATFWVHSPALHHECPMPFFVHSDAQPKAASTHLAHLMKRQHMMQTGSTVHALAAALLTIVHLDVLLLVYSAELRPLAPLAGLP